MNESPLRIGIAVPTYLREAELVDTLRHLDRQERLPDEILVIDPRSRRVLARVDLSTLRSRFSSKGGHAEVLNGIAYHAERDTFFLTGKYWPKMFEVRFVVPNGETGG